MGLKKYEDKMDDKNHDDNEEFIEELKITWQAAKLSLKFLVAIGGIVVFILTILNHIQTLAK